jgi:primosomal protein N'
MGPSSQEHSTGDQRLNRDNDRVSVPIGRDDVVQATERLLDVAQHQPVGLALEGDAGMGKTTVWLHAVAQAVGAGHRVLQARPAES